MCLDGNEHFEFLIGGEFLRVSLDDHLQEKSLSSVCAFCLILKAEFSISLRDHLLYHWLRSVIFCCCFVLVIL